MTGIQRTQGSTRAEFLERAALGGAAIALGASGPGLLGADEASAASAAGPVRRFFSRPDLRPPHVTVLRTAARTADGLLFLTPTSGPGQRGALILDNAGDVVWFRPSTPDTTMDFRPGIYKGAPVLTWWEGRHRQGVGLRGSYVVVDASYREIARFRSRNELKPDFHEYLLTSAGTAFVLSYDPVSADLSSVGGSSSGRVYEGVVQELAIPSGRVLFEWRSLKHVPVDESYQTQVADPYDYFHVNSVGFDSDGHLLVSARNTWTIYKIHRRTGEVIWRLGGKKSDFAMGAGTRFAFQHDARSRGGSRISLFDNGPVPGAKRRSRALVIALDVGRKRATLARQLVHAPPLFARVTGNSHVLPNRNTLVCWGNTGYFTEYSRNGAKLFDAKLPKGGQNYRVYRFPWVGRPSERPRLVSRTPRGGPERLYASWNGATEVASWQLRVGPTRAKLAADPPSPKRGFETELAVPRNARYAAAVALDRRGNPLGTSAVVRI